LQLKSLRLRWAGLVLAQFVWAGALGLGLSVYFGIDAAQVWPVLLVVACVSALVAWLALHWANRPFWRGLQRIAQGARQGRAAAADLHAGVPEIDRSLQDVTQALQAQAQTWEPLRAMASALGEGRQVGPVPAAWPAEAANLAAELADAAQQLQAFMGALREAMHAVHVQGMAPQQAFARLPLEWRQQPQMQAMVDDMQSGSARLQASVQAMTQVVERNSTTLAELSWQAKSISEAMSMLAVSGQQAASSSQSLASNSEQVSAQASQVGELARQAQENSSQGQRELEHTVTSMQAMSEHTQVAGASITRLQSNSRKIEHIVQLIREIADKINLLSLNAAIEAARAGEHGRGFAVVAQEVRNLAEKTFHATQEIDASVGGILSETEHAVQSINTLLVDVQANVGQIEQVGQRLNGILDFSSVLSDQMGGIVTASQTSTQQVRGISRYLSEIEQELNVFGQSIEAQQVQIHDLAKLGEDFFDQLLDMRFENLHSRMFQVARAAADAVQQVFEQSLAQGKLRIDDLLSQAYEPIEGTNPPQYRSRFDAFTDLVLPAIQEQVLSENAELIFAICTQKTGYVPTHNNKFAKPPTGQYEVDLVNSRSKRIFNDPTGIRCGSHTKKMLLQTYKRDTGEIMHDLSVPIHVQGNHWGGFRMGYKAH
jgi:methyl-accepting chemotaxis protein